MPPIPNANPPRQVAPTQPPPPAPVVVEVRIVANDVIVDDRLMMPGDMIRVDAEKARAWVEDGRASWVIGIECVHPVMCNLRYMTPGETMEVDEETARRLHRDGYVNITTLERLVRPLDAPFPRRPANEPPHPYANEPRIKVEILEDGTNIGGEVRDKGTIFVFETQAVNLLVAGKALLDDPKSAPQSLTARVHEARHPAMA